MTRWLALALTSITVSAVAAAAPKESTAEAPGRLELLPVPPTVVPPAEPAAQGLRIVFVNFEGVTLTGSNQSDDGPTNQSAIPVIGEVIGPGQTITVPTFQPSQLGDNGAGLSRSQIISRVINQLYASHAPYDVEFVTTRLRASDYPLTGRRDWLMVKASRCSHS